MEKIICTAFICAALLGIADSFAKTPQEATQAPLTSSIETCYNGTIVVEYYQGESLQAVLQPLVETKGKFSKVGLPIPCKGEQ